MKKYHTILIVFALLLVQNRLMAQLNSEKEIDSISFSDTLNCERVLIPVTSQRIDVDDDPENLYSGSPLFDWSFFANNTRIITKYAGNYLEHRKKSAVPYSFYLMSDKHFDNSPSPLNAQVIGNKPIIPVVQFAKVGKINRVEENGEKARAYDLEPIITYQKQFPNLILGGGQAAEIDGGFANFFGTYYADVSTENTRSFPTSYFDFIESNVKRSPLPYMKQEHNNGWGIHYVASERIMSLSVSQLFHRYRSSIVPNLVMARSASRQYPHPFGVQFSGQLYLEAENVFDILNKGAEPIYKLPKAPRLGHNYHKSNALNRQMLYLAWLNGARYFTYEGGEFVRMKGAKILAPLGHFTTKVSKVIDDFGPVGPVQTPIALISEFGNAWRAPKLMRKKQIEFSIIGNLAYQLGDYQQHGLWNFFYPNYLQTELVYEKSMSENYALAASPFGDCLDFIRSDIRKEALARYALLIWTGVPPRSPSVVRDKLMHHITKNQGRVILFGEAAKTIFPSLFIAEASHLIKAGEKITYGKSTFIETADFLVKEIKPKLKVKVLARAGGKPLIVQYGKGLVLVLSDYGMNHTKFLEPDEAIWEAEELVTKLPYKLMKHTNEFLSDEASKHSLFSVSNPSLHYIVTRPRKGEYVLGIFNDRLNSEAFEIKSNIGSIVKLEDYVLIDGKEELKLVVNGAAYAPAGLRMKADSLPDYGLSDASHIEGRDVRLFRIKINESTTKELASIHYPNRPKGRVLSVEGLEDIRHKLQEFPSFFQWFDGIHICSKAFLSMDTLWLKEQAKWLTRRGVRVVVSTSKNDHEESYKILKKLSILKDTEKDLIIEKPSRKQLRIAEDYGIKLIDNLAVNWISNMEDKFKKSASINILDLYYSKENDLYDDVQYFIVGNQDYQPKGNRDEKKLVPISSSKEKIKNTFVNIGQPKGSLKDFLLKNSKQLADLGGVKISSTYLLSKTNAALQADGDLLKEMDLDVLVDLRPDQLHFDRITFYPHIPNYKEGLTLAKEIIDKMQLIHAKDLIVGIKDAGDMRNKSKYIEQRDITWGKFADWAEKKKINIHLLFDLRLRFSKSASFAKNNVFVINGNKGKQSAYSFLITKEDKDFFRKP